VFADLARAQLALLALAARLPAHASRVAAGLQQG